MLPEQVMRYLDLGWKILPITAGAKVPAGGCGLKHASGDRAVVQGWANKWPGCGWGVACKESGFVAIDVDPRNGGERTLAELVGELGPLPAGPMQQTGGGGAHHLMRHPGCKLPGGLGPGLDIKSNGYVLLPPSRTKEEYRWIRTPWETDMPEMPPAWLCRVKGVDERPVSTSKRARVALAWAQKALDAECSNVERSSEGERNNALNVAAFSVGQIVAGGSIDREVARVSLLEAARRAGLTPVESGKTIDSGLRAGATCPRTPSASARQGAARERPREECREQQVARQAATEPEDDGVIPLSVVGVPAAAPPPVEWLFDGLIPRGACCVIGGTPKACKSFLADDLLVAGALGQPLIGRFSSERQIRAVAYSAEGGTVSIQRRLWGLCMARGGGNPAKALEGIKIVDERITLADTDVCKRLKKTLQVYQPDVFLIDPLVAVHSADENSANEMQDVLNAIRDLSLVVPGMTTVVVHHVGKAEGRSQGYSLRGSSAIEAWRDTLISVVVQNPDDKRSPRRVIVSHRDSESPSDAWFTFETVALPEHQYDSKPVLGYRLDKCDAAESAKPGPKLDETTLELLSHDVLNWVGRTRAECARCCKSMGRDKFNRYFNELRSRGVVDLDDRNRVVAKVYRDDSN